MIGYLAYELWSGDVAAQPLEPVALMGLAGDGAVQEEAVLLDGGRLGCRVGSGQGWILEAEGFTAGALSDRDAVADRGGVQVVQRVSGDTPIALSSPIYCPSAETAPGPTVANGQGRFVTLPGF